MQPSGVLRWDLSRLMEALRLSAEDVISYFTDGRRISFILERRIAREVLGGTIAESEGADYDVVDTQGRRWEVRSISEGGIYFCPSYMVGSGRHFERAGFLSKLGGLQGYVVSDISTFPEVRYWVVEAKTVRDWWDQGKLGTSTKISREKALALLNGIR